MSNAFMPRTSTKNHRILTTMHARNDTLPWPNPFCCLPRVTPSRKFLYHIKFGTVQYAFITPVLGLLAVGLSFVVLFCVTFSNPS